MNPVHKHHRKRRSQGGDDSYGNIIELPAEVHELVHREPEKAYEYGLLVKSHDDPAEIRPDVPSFLADLGVEITPSGRPKKKKLEGEERRKRRTISLKVPNDTEDGGAVYDETLDRVKGKLVSLGLYDESDHIPAYEAWIAAANDWLNS